MIDIIIPAYNSHDTIEQTLFSIAYQSMIKDINVYLVDDCSKKDYKDTVKFFSNFMKIKELRLDKNSGPGVARQYGIDNSNAEYIIFIDSDDVFSDSFAVERLYNAIKQDDYDVVIGEFVEESNNEFITHSNDKIWLHGKIYKREKIKKEKVKFNDTRANEDNGFNQCIFLSDAKVKNLDQKVYIWRSRSNSITRSNDGEYSYKSVYGYAYNILEALKHAKSRKYDKEKISELALSSLVAIYHYYLEYESKIEESLVLSKQIKKIYMENELDENKVADIIYMQLMYVVNGKFKYCLLNPKYTFNEFLNIIEAIEV